MRPLAGTRLLPLAITLAAASTARAGEESYSLHFQGTVATQYHPPFQAPYTGAHSMIPQAESATSVVLDLYAGARLWRGAELYLQPELAGGRGLSSTLGVAAFPSGEVYRVGSPTPTVTVGRFFLRQRIDLGGRPIAIEGGPNQLAGSRTENALTLTFGKVSVPDFVDGVPFVADPHAHFMSWGLFASAAYDYPADTRGFTWGLAGDLAIGLWSLRAGVFLEPTTANGSTLEWRLGKAHGLVAEVERRFGNNGAARVLFFFNEAHMGSYAEALEQPSPPNIVSTRAFGRTKAGVAASANQDLGAGLSVFIRASFDDGRNETWAFTEIDRSLALGAIQSGGRWGRPLDEAGLALVVSGLSNLHSRYLGAGGLGFILGDGALSYAPEVLGEVYYMVSLTQNIWLGANYQPIFDPAFNADRGPIHVLTGRLHVAL